MREKQDPARAEHECVCVCVCVCVSGAGRRPGVICRKREERERELHIPATIVNNNSKDYTLQQHPQ